MRKFRIYSSELVLYETVVEAESEAEAWDKVIHDSDTDEVDRTGFQTDNIEEIDNEL